MEQFGTHFSWYDDKYHQNVTKAGDRSKYITFSYQWKCSQAVHTVDYSSGERTTTAINGLTLITYKLPLVVSRNASTSGVGI